MMRFKVFFLSVILFGSPMLSAEESDLKALKTEILVSKSEKKALAQINKLLKRYKGTPLESDLLLRKAELYMRKSKTERFYEMNRESETVVKFAPKKVRSASSKKYILKAIALYDSIIKYHKQFDKLDVVIFNDAFANQQIGRTKRAEQLYWMLIRNFSGSPLVADSHLAIGEMAFKQQRYEFALKHFNSIKKFPQARVYPYGVYKAAWTQYNLRDTVSAMKDLEEVITYGKFVNDHAIDARLDLRKEALSDTALFFPEVFTPSQAYSYFKKQSHELDPSPYLFKLVNLYGRHSKFKNKTVVLHDFINNEQTIASLPQAYNMLINTYETMKSRKAAVREMNNFYAVCNPGHKWHTSFSKIEHVTKVKDDPNIFKGNTQATIGSCQELVSKVSLHLSSKWLEIWNKKKDPKSLLAENAENGFRIYLRRKLPTEKYNTAHFAFSELLFNRGKFRESSENYYIVGNTIKNPEKAHDARYASIVALEKDVKDIWNDKDEKQFQKQVANYVLNHPKGKYVLDLRFKVALIAFGKKKFAEAAPQLLAIGNEFSKKEKGLKAQDLYLEILNINKDYMGLKTYSASLLAKKPKGLRKKKLKKIYEEAYFVQVQKLEESKKGQEAIQGYLGFSKENPKSPLAEKGILNAIELQFEGSLLQEGAKLSLEYYRTWPKSPKVVGLLSRAAQTFESMGQLKESAEIIEELSKVDTAKKDDWKLIAADFYFLDGKKSKAKGIFSHYRKSKNPKHRDHALLKLRDMANPKSAEYRQVLQWIVEANIQPDASHAQLLFLEELMEKKKYPEAFTLSRRILGSRKAGASNYSLAKARYIQGLILENEFRRQSVKTRLEKLTTVLELKTARLEKAQLAYQDAMKFGDPKITVLAMKQLAFCYRHYSESLNTMPTPVGLGPEDEVAFRSEISRMTIPMEEKSVETLMSAIKEAHRLGLKDGSIAEIKKVLKDYGQSSDEEVKPVIITKDPEMVFPVEKLVGV